MRDERTRIARELHDVIAHHLSLMVIQAGGARRLVEQDPARARQALTVIEEYGRRGLESMPSLLKALRSDSPLPDRAPAPRLDDLPALVEEVQRSGQAVTLSVRGKPRPLPDGHDLAAYRIVQEALTNAVRHAPGADVEVTVDYRSNDVVVEVADDGPGLAARDTGGHGLTGIRERAMLAGGSLEITETPGGGWTVRAVLPYPGGVIP